MDADSQSYELEQRKQAGAAHVVGADQDAHHYLEGWSPKSSASREERDRNDLVRLGKRPVLNVGPTGILLFSRYPRETDV